MLSAGLVRWLGQTAMRLNSPAVETLQYVARATPADFPAVYAGIQGFLTTYTEHVIAAQALITGEARVLRTDRKLWIPTATVTWAPTLYDEVVRADETTWRVMATTDGEHKAFWIFQIRMLLPR